MYNYTASGYSNADMIKSSYSNTVRSLNIATTSLDIFLSNDDDKTKKAASTEDSANASSANFVFFLM